MRLAAPTSDLCRPLRARRGGSRGTAGRSRWAVVQARPGGPSWSRRSSARPSEHLGRPLASLGPPRVHSCGAPGWSGPRVPWARPALSWPLWRPARVRPGASSSGLPVARSGATLGCPAWSMAASSCLDLMLMWPAMLAEALAAVTRAYLAAGQWRSGVVAGPRAGRRVRAGQWPSEVPGGPAATAVLWPAAGRSPTALRFLRAADRAASWAAGPRRRVGWRRGSGALQGRAVEREDCRVNGRASSTGPRTRRAGRIAPDEPHALQGCRRMPRCRQCTPSRTMDVVGSWALRSFVGCRAGRARCARRPRSRCRG